MKVIVVCEFSGIVRDSFIKHGHDAISCDLLPTEKSGPHIQGDVRDIDLSQYDLMIAHPPCTYLSVSGARWNVERPSRIPKREAAIEFVRYLLNAPVKGIALENPISIISSRIRPPNQIIQPYQFGHGETKATCFWLKNLRPLVPTCIVDGRIPRVAYEPKSDDRWKNRSRTLTGIAEAMASQWGLPLLDQPGEASLFDFMIDGIEQTPDNNIVLTIPLKQKAMSLFDFLSEE